MRQKCELTRCGDASQRRAARTHAGASRTPAAARRTQAPPARRERRRRTEQRQRRRARRRHRATTCRAPDREPPVTPERSAARSGQRELLGGQHVVGLGDPGRIAGQRHRAVVQARIAARARRTPRRPARRGPRRGAASDPGAGTPNSSAASTSWASSRCSLGSGAGTPNSSAARTSWASSVGACGVGAIASMIPEPTRAVRRASAAASRPSARRPTPGARRPRQDPDVHPGRADRRTRTATPPAQLIISVALTEIHRTGTTPGGMIRLSLISN